MPENSANHLAEKESRSTLSSRNKRNFPSTEQKFDGSSVLLGLPRANLNRAFPGVESELEILQDWEGVVEQIAEEEGVFFARLADRTSKKLKPLESAKVPISDVPADDRDLLKTGAIFYITILRRRNGDRITRMVFRRLPAWTRKGLEAAREKAEQFERFLNGIEY